MISQDMKFEILFNKLPYEIRELYFSTYQSPKHHAEGSVYAHSKLVAESLPDEWWWAACALFHDYGKLHCTKFQYSKKYGVKISSIGHECFAKYAIALYQHLIPELIQPHWEMITQVCGQHMRAHLYIDGKMSNKKKRESFESLEFFNEIIEFAKADERGRKMQDGLPVGIITVGIPGSGKSTWVNEFVKTHEGWVVINPDSIRKELTGDISNQSRNKDVWNTAYLELDNCLANKENFIFDSTACNAKTINTLVSKCREKAILCFKIFEETPEVCIDRIQKDIYNSVDRSKVPEEIVYKMYENFADVKKYVETKFHVLED